MKASTNPLITFSSLTLIISMGCSTARDQLSQHPPSHQHTPMAETRDLELVQGSADSEGDDWSGDSTTTSSQEVVHRVGNEDGQALPSELDAPVAGVRRNVVGDGELSDDVGASNGSWAEEGVTLESLEQLALQNNPAIRQASAAAHEAMGVRTQVGLKANPVIGYFGEEIGNEQSGGLQGIFASQTFVTGGKLALNRDVLDQDVQSILWEAEAQRYRVRTDVRRSFYDALAAQRRLQLAQSFEDVARKGVQVAEDRFRALEGSRPDVLQSEIQLNEVSLIIQSAQIDFEAAWRELASVAGVPYMAAPTLVGTLERTPSVSDVESVYAELVACSPELQAARARVARARANITRQGVEPIPNLQAQIGFGHDTGTGDEFANVQLGLPIPIHNKNQGNIYAAQAEYARATQDVRRLELSLRARLARAMREYDIAQVTVVRYENQILPKADESLDLSEEAYTAGEFDFLRVLVARREYFDTNLKYVSALANLAKADAVIDGLLLSGGLTDTVDFEGGDGLRGQALSGQ